ncbi:hypothetical protein, partial [Paraburkholderia sediminicola]
MLNGHRGLLRVVVHLESGFVHLHTPVTRASFFQRRCARRSVLLKTTRYVWTLASRQRTVALYCTPITITIVSVSASGTATSAATVIATGTETVMQRTDISCEAGVPG